MPLKVHRHEGEPCPRCGETLRAVHFEDYVIAYCPHCQTEDRVLKDRRLSRLLRMPVLEWRDVKDPQSTSVEEPGCNAGSSRGPASISVTRLRGFSLSRYASTAPALPPPTMT